MSKRLREDEAAIADLQNDVANIKRFKVGNRDITMREVRNAEGFRFAPPQPPSAPRVNVNVQAPRNTYADVREGERQAFLSGYRNTMPYRNYGNSIAVAPSGGYRSRSAYLKSKAAIVLPRPYTKMQWIQMKKATASARAAVNVLQKMKPVTGVMRAASKASLARARLSMKKGGRSIPKKTLMKAGKQATAAVYKRDLMKKTKNTLLKAVKLESKEKIATFLANCYAK